MLLLPRTGASGQSLLNALNAVQALTETLARWTMPQDVPLAIVVPDTNVLLENPAMINAIEWHELMSPSVRSMTNIVVVIPLLVIDELDSAKRDRVRSRARQTVKLLFDLFEDNPTSRVPLSPPQHLRGNVHVELLLDEPGHTRLPNSDDELIDRSVALKALTGKRVSFVSYDTGAVFRAIAAGLDGHRLSPE